MTRLVSEHFTIEFWKKLEPLGSTTQGIMILQDDNKALKKELEYQIKKQLEKIVIDKGWFTGFCGAFGVAYKKDDPKQICMLVVYKPSFQYLILTNKREIQEELIYLGSDIKL